jgi:hypothetical protein
MADVEPIDSDVLLREIRSFLPAPVREEIRLNGALILTGGQPGEVVVRVAGSRITVAECAVVWHGPSTPVVHPRTLASLNWARLPAAALLQNLHSLIESACEIRRAKYRTCERCGETKPPERMHNGVTCQSCAERYLGVVH